MKFATALLITWATAQAEQQVMPKQDPRQLQETDGVCDPLDPLDPDCTPICDPLVDPNCPVDGGEDVIIIEEEE